jgi:ribonuclease PH
MKRHDGRQADELRTLAITYGIFEYALGSVLFELGKTKVLCAVTVQPSVPPFIRGQGMGWLTAEYGLLPTSTQVRTAREATQMKRPGRSIEISRLISRVLRTVVDLTALGDNTITIDCDVLQADGGTRTAAISGSYAALCRAQERLLHQKIITRPLLKDAVAAVAVGVRKDGTLLLDPDYQEDSEAIADINVVMTYAGRLIELQGGAEKEPIAWSLIPQIGLLAQQGIAGIQQLIDPRGQLLSQDQMLKKKEKIPLFSLMNRHISTPPV